MHGFWLRSPLRVPEDGQSGGSGSGSAGAATFDPTAFTASFTAELHKALNGFASSLRKDIGKLVQPPAPPTSGDPAPAGDPAPEPGTDPKAKPDPEIARLRKTVEQLTKSIGDERAARIETEKAAAIKEQNAILRTELGKLGVAAERVDAAMRIFGPDVKRAQDGSLVGGADEVPLAEWLGETMKGHQYLLPPKDVGGAGTRPGGVHASTKPVDIDSIRPGMSADDLARARAEIARVATETMAGRQVS